MPACETLAQARKSGSGLLAPVSYKIMHEKNLNTNLLA
jgi:hypothetical protein